ncbi:MAG: hypothetical protein AAF292_10065 [Pseudomonadota bacterium]
MFGQVWSQSTACLSTLAAAIPTFQAYEEQRGIVTGQYLCTTDQRQRNATKLATVILVFDEDYEVAFDTPEGEGVDLTPAFVD